MHLTIVPLLALLLAMGAGIDKTIASEKCHIGDSALCLAAPGCHWDVNRRGCYEGDLLGQDACAAHEDERVCDTNTTLGCKWNAEQKKCETKSGS